MKETNFTKSKFFNRATDSYLSGNKLAASKYSAKARELDQVMKSVNYSAGKTIYQQRNSNLEEGVVDLHGLHPQEAIDILGEELRRLKTSGYRGKLMVVTGTGNHSKGKGKLGPEVEKFLRESGYRIGYGSLVDGRGGILSIEI